MERLQTLEKIVLEALEAVPETREDDYILLLEVCERINADIHGQSFMEALKNHKKLRIPNWKSVERCRRKIQARRPDLISPTAAKKRRKAENTFTEYAHS